MLLGLGAGMGFIYWKMKFGSSTYVFLGGRGNNKNFFDDLGRRTGVKIRQVSTGSAKKVEDGLLERLGRQEPVMLFGDMGLLPWFRLPPDYHFGGHTFVVCGYDGKTGVLVSDIDQHASGLKKGFYFSVSLQQLRRARGSTHKPFPPRNTYLEFDFTKYRDPGVADICAAIKQTVGSQLNPPIKNMGVKGLRHTAEELLTWPDTFGERDLRANLFSIYVFFEIGGTGGGCFRYMYSRFLEESARIAKDDRLLRSAAKVKRAGGMFSEIGLLFQDAQRAKDPEERIETASGIFRSLADLEEEAYAELAQL
jgi:hypothetical protein